MSLPPSNPGRERIPRWAGLIQRARAGDGAAHEELLRRYRPLVVGMAFRYIGPGIEHDDLVQEGMIGLLAAIARFDPGADREFSTYAGSLIRGACLHYVRDHRSPVRVPGSAQARGIRPPAIVPLTDPDDDDTGEGIRRVPTMPADPIDLGTAVVDRIALHDAMARLNRQQRQVIHAFYWRGLLVREIAEELHIPVRAVLRVLRSALEVLRAEFDDRGGASTG